MILPILLLLSPVSSKPCYPTRPSPRLPLSRHPAPRSQRFRSIFEGPSNPLHLLHLAHPIPQEVSAYDRTSGNAGSFLTTKLERSTLSPTGRRCGGRVSKYLFYRMTSNVIPSANPTSRLGGRDRGMMGWRDEGIPGRLTLGSSFGKP